MKGKCNASANLTRTLPPTIVGDLVEFKTRGKGGAFNLLLLHTKARYLPSSGTTLWPWFVTRLISIPHVELVCIYGNVSVRSSVQRVGVVCIHVHLPSVRDIHEYGVKYFTCVLQQQVNFKLWNKNVYQKIERYQKGNSYLKILKTACVHRLYWKHNFFF